QTGLQKQRRLAPTTTGGKGRQLLRNNLNRNHHRRRVKTKRSGAATLADGESSNVIVLILVVLATHEAKVICVPGRKAKDQKCLEQLPNLILKLMEEVKELKLSNSDLIENIHYKEGVASLEGFSATLSTVPDHQLHASASLAGFIDVSHLVSEVEEVEQVRKGMGNCGSPVSLDHFEVKVSLILAWASLAAVNLDAVKAQELGIARINIDAFARDLWKKSRFLTTHLDLDYFTTGYEASLSAMPRAQPFLADSHANFPQTGSASTCASILLSRVVAIKILLLLAARSFAAPSEYLKLHLDTISSAVEASLDSPCDDDVPLEEREWRWQLWSFLCVLDWTSPGIYHNGSYFIRPEMHSDPPSKVPGVPDDGTHSPTMETEHLERLSQTRYFLEYALALANLSRRAEDCIIHPGPISPAQAAELCSELDALDHKLSFYQLLGIGGTGRGGGGGEGGGPNHIVSGSAIGGGRVNGSGSSHTSSNEDRVSLQRALQVQKVHLSLELGLIRFKLFRHEAFHLMHDSTTSGPLRMMCMDACMDACILVLSQCRDLGMGVPHMVNLLGAAEGMRNMASTTDLASGGANGENTRPFPGIFRRVIQPASSAALVGQVLIHASQSTDGLGLLIPDKHTNTSSRPISRTGINSSTCGNSTSDFYSYAERSLESFAPHHFANGNGGASWTGRFGREKVSILQWHVDTVMTELEALQSTSPLARYKLALHRQCM
ncbi:MAG: hypothetical protein Q9164_007100, partial [Protoblastenia rupestris]